MGRTKTNREIGQSINGESFVEKWRSGTEPTLTRGQLFFGDNLEIMRSLVSDYSQRFQLVYLDPPFDVGTTFKIEKDIGNLKCKSGKKLRIEAYRDQWQPGEYRKMMYERVAHVRDLISETGALFLHCDYRTTAYYRIILEEIFGPQNYLNEIIWSYKTGGMPQKQGFGRKHDTIHLVAKNIKKLKWNSQTEKSYLRHKYGFKNIEIYEDEVGTYSEVGMRDVWDIPALRGNQPERVDYPTQKPEKLLERIISCASDPGDLIGDFFAGSGTSLAVAHRNGRHWIGIDSGQLAINTIRKRLARNLEKGSFEIVHPELGTIKCNNSKQDLIGKLQIVCGLKGDFREYTLAANSQDLLEVDGWAIVGNEDCKTNEIIWSSFRQRKCTSLVTSITTIPARQIIVYPHAAPPLPLVPRTSL